MRVSVEREKGRRGGEGRGGRREGRGGKEGDKLMLIGELDTFPVLHI